MPPTHVSCPFEGCNRLFPNQRGVNAHIGRKHKTRFDPHNITNIHYDLLPQATYNDQMMTDDDQNYGDYNDNITYQEPFELLQNPQDNDDPTPESHRYAPFTHEQWWLLNWMHTALVSQSQQNKFYKVMNT